MTSTSTDRGDRPAPVAEPLALVRHLRSEGVTVIDANRHEPLAQVGAGRKPHALAVHPGGRRGYVPYVGSNTLEVIDVDAVRAGNGDRLVDAARVTFGTPTACADATPDGALLAIDAYEDDRVTFLDPATLDVVARVRTGETLHHPQCSADSQICYVPNTDTNTVTVLDTQALREGDGHAPIVTTIDLPEGSAPSGCFRTDRRDLL